MEGVFALFFGCGELQLLLLNFNISLSNTLLRLLFKTRRHQNLLLMNFENFIVCNSFWCSNLKIVSACLPWFPWLNSSLISLSFYGVFIWSEYLIILINLLYSFRSYEAEVACLEVKSEKTSASSETVASKRYGLWLLPKKSERVVCRVNCSTCNTNRSCVSTSVPPEAPSSDPEEQRWLKSKGSFLSVGAAIISCRNERAPDGLVADAHLSDGFLHLILIKNCPLASYLWYVKCFFPSPFDCKHGI